MRAVIIIAAAVLVQGADPLDAAALPCSTWQGIRTCQDAHGYVSHETERMGQTSGWDNRGDRWSTSRWRDTDITTVEPRPER
jgi:hypothetical protein